MTDKEESPTVPNAEFLQLEIGLLREDQLFYIKEMRDNERLIFLGISAIYAFYLSNPPGNGIGAILILPTFLAVYGQLRAKYIWERLAINLEHCALLEDFFGGGRLGIARNFINVRNLSDNYRWPRKLLWWPVLAMTVLFSGYFSLSSGGDLAKRVLNELG